MAKVATNKNTLSKRLQRFFNASNSGRQQVKHIVDQLAVLGEVYLFGGAIRDIALEGMRHFYSDLDFVIDCQPAKLDKLMKELESNYRIERNKFGGFRLYCSKWWLDIWAIENTWAFKQQLIPYNNTASLLETTILNWDAALYQVANNQLITSPDYFKQLSDGQLDLVLAKNPNPLGALVRVLRTLCSKQVTVINANLVAYLNTHLANIALVEICEYEQDHYKSCYLSRLNFDHLKQICCNTPPHKSIAWQPSSVNLPLPW